MSDEQFIKPKMPIIQAIFWTDAEKQIIYEYAEAYGRQCIAHMHAASPLAQPKEPAPQALTDDDVLFIAALEKVAPRVVRSVAKRTAEYQRDRALGITKQEPKS